MITNRSNYIRDRRIVIREMKKSKSFSTYLDLHKSTLKPKHELMERVETNFSSLIPRTNVIQSDKIFIDSLYTTNWQFTYGRMLELIKEPYPITHKLIHNISPMKFSTLERWICEIVKKLDPYDYSVQLDNFMDWLDLPGDDTDWRNILYILRRHEVYKTITSKRRKRGPKKGHVLANISLREKIKKATESQISTKGKINAAEIARELNLSRQRVNVIIKELKLRS